MQAAASKAKSSPISAPVARSLRFIPFQKGNTGKKMGKHRHRDSHPQTCRHTHRNKGKFTDT